MATSITAFKSNGLLYLSYMTSIVYETRGINLHQLHAEIKGAAVQIRNNPRFFTHFHFSLINRVNLCIQVNGGLIEQLL